MTICALPPPRSFRLDLVLARLAASVGPGHGAGSHLRGERDDSPTRGVAGAAAARTGAATAISRSAAIQRQARIRRTN